MRPGPDRYHDLVTEDSGSADDIPEFTSESTEWRFDPANPPDAWTKEMIGQLTMGEIEDLSAHDNGILSAGQQASFDAALAESNKEFAAKFEPVAQAMKTKIAEIAPGLNESVKRLQGLAQKSYSLPTFDTPGLDSVRRLQEDQANRRKEMEELTESIGEANRKREERAEAQAKATLEIANAQTRLQEMQVEALELARQQAAASAEIALAQQSVLAAITEELGVLQEQNRGQRELIRSGWAGGIVMEWTLFVAIIAAVATIALGTVGPDGIQWFVWVGAAVVTVALTAALGIWHWRRQPVSEVE